MRFLWYETLLRYPHDDQTTDFFFLVTAIVSATISPACAFISGKGGDWIEICSGLGIKSIQDDKRSTLPDVTEKQCPFCLQFVNGGMISQPTVISAPIFISAAYDFVSEDARTKALKTIKNKIPPSIIFI